MGASKATALATARHEIPSEAHFPFTPPSTFPAQRHPHAPSGDQDPGCILGSARASCPAPGKPPRCSPAHAAARASSEAQQPFSPPGAHSVRTPCPRAAAASLIGRAPGKQGLASQWEGCARGQHESPGARSRGAPRPWLLYRAVFRLALGALFSSLRAGCSRSRPGVLL